MRQNRPTDLNDRRTREFFDALDMLLNMAGGGADKISIFLVNPRGFRACGLVISTRIFFDWFSHYSYFVLVGYVQCCVFSDRVLVCSCVGLAEIGRPVRGSG